MDADALMEARRHVTSLFFNRVDLAAHHIRSYNDFVEKWIPDIIEKNGIISTVYEEEHRVLSLSNCRIQRPDLLATDCHVYAMTYAWHCIVKFTYVVKGISHKYKLERELLLAANPDQSKLRFIPLERFTEHIKTEVDENLYLFSMPCMVGSSPCHTKHGFKRDLDWYREFPGTLIVDGKRRYLPSRRELIHNAPMIHDEGMVEYRSEYLTKPHRSTSTANIFAVPSMKRNKFVAILQIQLKLSFGPSAIPLPVMLLAMGWKFKEFELAMQVAAGFNRWCKHKLVFKRYLMALGLGLHGCKTKTDAELYIGKLYGKPAGNTSVAHHIIKQALLPNVNGTRPQHINGHIELPAHPKIKGVILAMLVVLHILRREKLILKTDLDDLMVSRTMTTGDLMAVKFRTEFIDFATKQAIKITRRRLKSNMEIDPSKIFNPDRLTEKLFGAIKTGTWSKKRVGVSQNMNVGNSNAVSDQMRKVASSCLSNSGKHIGPRMVHASHRGYLCCTTTVEDEDAGLILQLACTATVSYMMNSNRIWYIIESNLPEGLFLPFAWPPPPSVLTNENIVSVFTTNGVMLGWVSDGQQLIDTVQYLCTNGSISFQTTYWFDKDQQNFHLQVDRGRIIRPLIVVKNIPRLFETLRQHGISKTSPICSLPVFRILRTNGCIQYLSPEQERTTTKIATRLTSEDIKYQRYSHLEMTDVAMISVTASLVTFFAHNQATRLTHWRPMSNQTISGKPCRDRGAPVSHKLRYGQRPVVVSQMCKDVFMHTEPCAMNMMVLIRPKKHNQEDSLDMSRKSIELGLGVSSSTQTYILQERGTTHRNMADQMGPPDHKVTVGLKAGAYSKVQANGLPKLRTIMEEEEVVIACVTPCKSFPASSMVNAPKKNQKRKRDKSVVVRPRQNGQVVHVSSTSRPGSNMHKVKIQTTRKPQKGDKFSARHSQKGTIGQETKPENMAFIDGLGNADLEFSPHGFPSRMTVGMLIEMLFGSSALYTGDLDAFIDPHDLCKPLEERLNPAQEVFRKMGLHPKGLRVAYDGITGNEFNTMMFYGCVTYHKLHHEVVKKATARSKGPRQEITRAPTENGRAKDGGQRLGNMEFENLHAHGVAEIVRERASTTADPHDMYLCKECGNVADGNLNIGYFRCPKCRTSENVRRVHIGYASHLLVNFVRAAGMKMNFDVDDL